MLEFRTLGSIDLRSGDGRRIEEVLRHRKRLSLLAYLSASYPPRRHRRDVLVTLLWPEGDEKHARSALRQELYQLRLALGPGVLLGDRAEDVGVDWAQFRCDAQQFQAALDGGRPAEALALWDGGFLAGLHVESGEFDRWLEETRLRLLNQAIDAARRLVEDAQHAGDDAAAVCWARRLAELAPYDETAWRTLIALLDGQGDRAGALSVYEEMVLRLRTGLEVEPSPETHGMIERIRSRVDVPATPRPTAWGRAVIGILPVENRTGDAALDALAWRVTDRLAQGLAGAMFADIAPIGDMHQVTAVVSATLYRQDQGLEVVPRLAEAGEHGRLVEMPGAVQLSLDASDVQLDTLVAHVLASVAVHYDPRFDAAATPERALPIRTPSWEAYLAYLQGSDLFGRYQASEGYGHLLRAYQLDPGFAKAGIFAAIALAESGDPARADALAASVMARNQPLTEYERTLGEWFLANLHGRRAEAYRAAVEGTAASGSPVFATLAGGEALRMNRPRDALARIEGTVTTQGWWRNRFELLDVRCGAAHALGDHRQELAAALEARGRHPRSAHVIGAEVRARAALCESGNVLSLVEEALTLPGGTVGPADVAWTAVQELDAHGQGAAAADARRVGLEWLSGRESPSVQERQLLVRLLLDAGDLEGAAKALAPLAPFADLESLGLAGVTAARCGDVERARGALAALEGLQNPYLGGRHLLLAAEIQLVLDPPATATSTLRRAFAAGLPFDVELHARPGLRPLAPREDFRSLLRARD